MTRTLLVVPTAAGASLARTCLGLVRALDRRGVNVAFVKPVAQPRADGGPDRSIALAVAATALRPPDPLSTAHLEQQLGSGGLDAVLEKIVAAWQPVHDRSDVVVVEGLSPGPDKLYASGLNQALAKAIDADVLLVASWPAAGRESGDDRADVTTGDDVKRLDGPLQYDAAAIASVAQNKRPESAVAGRASVFIFPDLDTGNTTYKAVQRSAQVVSVGPMLQGLAKPVNDLSRGALVDDIVYTVALTAIQSRAG